jgi:CBS domain-containing protein
MARSDPSITIGFGGTAARPTPFLEYGERQEISEIMTRSVDLIDPNAPATEAARKTREDDVGILPVGENDRLVGMMTDRDIVMRGLSSDGSVGRVRIPGHLVGCSDNIRSPIPEHPVTLADAAERGFVMSVVLLAVKRGAGRPRHQWEGPARGAACRSCG